MQQESPILYNMVAMSIIQVQNVASYDSTWILLLVPRSKVLIYNAQWVIYACLIKLAL